MSVVVDATPTIAKNAVITPTTNTLFNFSINELLVEYNTNAHSDENRNCPLIFSTMVCPNPLGSIDEDSKNPLRLIPPCAT